MATEPPSGGGGEPPPTPPPLDRMGIGTFCEKSMSELKALHVMITHSGNEVGEFKGVNATD